MTAGRETTEDGTCSLCGAAAVRGESGAWWHVADPCFGKHPWYAAPLFVVSPPARDTT